MSTAATRGRSDPLSVIVSSGVLGQQLVSRTTCYYASTRVTLGSLCSRVALWSLCSGRDRGLDLRCVRRALIERGHVDRGRTTDALGVKPVDKPVSGKQRAS